MNCLIEILFQHNHASCCKVLSLFIYLGTQKRLRSCLNCMCIWRGKFNRQSIVLERILLLVYMNFTTLQDKQLSNAYEKTNEWSKEL